MSIQKGIAGFFSPAPNKKRSAADANLTSAQDENKCPRNQAVDQANSKLSPEQKERIEAKHAEAEKKLLSKKGPQNFGPSWKKALASEFDREYYKRLAAFVEEERKRKTVYPPAKDVFTWTLQTDIHEVKVVIIGQDPYHGPGQAHGLCFSVLPGVHPPPSLVNIYKALAADIEGFTTPTHGFLMGWAKQGVLLLNACLTVVASQANSHKDKGWEQFTDAVIRWINNNLRDVVFMLWGSYAQKKGNFIDKKKHCVLKAVHPSPLSAHRGFFSCKHFSQANDFLKKHGKRPVNWNYLPVDL